MAHRVVLAPSSCLVLFALLGGCEGSPPAGPPDAGRDAAGSDRDAASGDAGSAVDAFRADAGPLPDTGPRPDAGTSTVAGGEVSGDWCGTVEVAATVTVPAGATLTVCAGAVVHFASSAALRVDGTLVLAGEDGLPITLDAATTWTGLVVAGTLQGAFVDVSDATLALSGLAGSSITLDDSTIASSSQTLALANGGTFDRTFVSGGSTVTVTGGVLRMVDSGIDLLHGPLPPDCTDWVGGGAVLDHVRFTGCHCPIHINRATETFSITNSILDGATNPVMIADSEATFTNNDFIGTSASLVLDIGDRTSIVCNLAGNYWDGAGGHVAQVGTANHAQFTGEDLVLDARVPGAGPR